MKYLNIIFSMIVASQVAAQEHVSIRIVKEFPEPGKEIKQRDLAQEFGDIARSVSQPPFSALNPTPLDGGYLIGAYSRAIELGLAYRKYSFIFVKGGQIRLLQQRAFIRDDTDADLVFTIIQDRFIKISGRNKRNDPPEFNALIAVWDDKPVTLEYLLRDEARLLRNAIFAYHGYKFESPDLQEYFAMLPWYKPTHDNVDKLLTDDERWIIEEIIKVEKTR